MAAPIGWAVSQMPWSEAGGVLNPLPLNSSGVNTAVDVVAPILVAATAKGVEGVKPPWNQPQDTPAATRLSIAPPSKAFCSSPYPWSWSQVSTSLMVAGSYRLGLTWLPLASLLGLFVSRLPEPPAPGVLASPLTLGVP